MYLSRGRLIAGVALSSVALMTAACSKTDNNQVPAEANKEPIELTMYMVSTVPGTEEEINEDFGKRVQKKYPHISLKYIQNQGNTTLDTLTASGTKVDLLYTGFGRLQMAKDNGYMGNDISDLITKHNFDLSRIGDWYLEQARSINDGKLNSLPFYDIRMLLYYNKLLFDKFGVPYPKDGMVWEDVYDIAKKLTRLEGGVQYIGYGNTTLFFVNNNQLSLPTVDTKTNKAAFNTDPWKQYIQMILPLYTANGSYKPTQREMTSFQTLFLNEKRVGMYFSYDSEARATNDAFGVDWDVVTLPEIKGLKGVGTQPYPVYLTIPATVVDPKRRDAAFQVIDALLTDEVQLRRSEDKALMPVLKDQKLKETFGKNASFWNGKNIKAVTAQTPAKTVPYSPYRSIGDSALSSAITQIVTGAKDINTALREAEEKLNKDIADKMSR